MGPPLADGADLEAAQAVSSRLHRAQPRRVDDLGGGLRGRRGAQLGHRSDLLGHLGRRRVRAGSASGRRRQGRRRARLRHGLHLRLARPPRCARGRRRPDARPARDRAAHAGASTGWSSLWSRRPQRRFRCPTPPSTSRSRSTARASGPIPTCWIPEAARLLAAGRPPRLPRQRDAGEPHLAGRGRAAGPAARSATTSACTGSSGRTTSRSTSTSATATGSASSGPTGSRSSASSRSRRPRTRSSTATTCCPTRTGRAAGRPRRSGWPASACSERPARAAAPARVGLAAAPRDPRAAADPLRRRRAPLRGGRLGDDPVEYTRAGKARSVDGGERPVLGVDTVVVCDGRRARQAR